MSGSVRRLALFVLVGLLAAMLAPGAAAELEAAPAVAGPTIDRFTAIDPGSGYSFGNDVAVSGDRFLVGEILHDVVIPVNGGTATYEYVGAAYLYARTADGWQVEQFLPGDWDTSGYTAFRYGSAVDIDGDRFVVGAQVASARGTSGAVYVYDKVPGGWSETKLYPSDGSSGDLFGNEVALDGDRLVVGAPQVDDPEYLAGQAYVFEFSGGSWTETAILSASDGTSYDKFGSSVAVDGDTILVGAEGWGPSATDERGKVYVFTQVGSDWVESSLPADPAPVDGDLFGNNVALDGDLAVVGAPQDWVGFYQNYHGSAFVFERNSGVWSQDAILIGPEPDLGYPSWIEHTFGTGVDVQAGILVVGASGQDVDGREDAGTAFRFSKESGVWTRSWLDPNAAAGSHAGGEVALDGDRVIIGARWDDNPLYNSGAAFLFEWHFCANRPATLVGTDGADTLDGTAGDDVIVGRAGDDTINGFGGHDFICAEGGDDRVIGGGGNDRIYGQSGNDVLRGKAGADRVAGSAGNDLVDGGGGNDRIYGGNGNDRLKDGAGVDLAVGEGGDDKMYAGFGDDVYRGGDGIDTLILAAANPAAVIDLAAATATGLGNDVVRTFENAIGSRYADTIKGSNAPNVLSGGRGDDTLEGRGGADKLIGGPGTDTLDGGPGADTCLSGEVLKAC
jgi:Ca2+-binding RTX toxin-like protein